MPDKSKVDIKDEKLELPNAKKILILIGQEEPTEEILALLRQLAQSTPVICSPLNNLEEGIEHVDAFIQKQEELAPDLLITSGLSVLSKKLKNFLRKNTPTTHLHFDEAGVSIDTYQSNPRLLRTPLMACLRKILDDQETDQVYLDLWKRYEKVSKLAISDYVSDCPFSEAKATFEVLGHLPENSILHLSNSMPVRYADLFGVKNSILSRSNRGTSGIDGCTSTAIGNALTSEKLNFLLTGDLAFLYDRNAFFHNYSVPNLRIIVMNNQGGGIFRLIEGPAKLPELNDYFETRHNRTSEYICQENGIEYCSVYSDGEIDMHWTDFIKPSNNAKLMEVFTDPITNQEVYKNLKSFIYERINSLEKSS